VLTGWFGGPKTDWMTRLNEQELVKAGLASLGDIFGLVPKELMRDLVAARAINWPTIPSHAELFRTRRPKRAGRSRRSQALTVRPSSFPAKRSTVGAIWAPSRPHWPASGDGADYLAADATP
jgi:hypothetical protein